ncbi:hypothetical protein MRB53_041729 [Persea americana]|nr:hypothetical protein MRB53_041729 [Persea americana]
MTASEALEADVATVHSFASERNLLLVAEVLVPLLLVCLRWIRQLGAYQRALNKRGLWPPHDDGYAPAGSCTRGRRLQPVHQACTRLRHVFFIINCQVLNLVRGCTSPNVVKKRSYRAQNLSLTNRGTVNTGLHAARRRYPSKVTIMYFTFYCVALKLCLSAVSEMQE